MNRLFLALMALLAGLLAQGGPAQARECVPGATQVSTLQAPLAQVSTASQAQQASSSASRGEEPVYSGSSSFARFSSVHTPTVQLGSDRARE